MVRLGAWSAFAFALLLASSAAAQPSDLAHQRPSPAEIDRARMAKMTSLIAKGDRERRAGRLPEAAQAYADALELGDNPLIGGRLGVLLVKFGNPVLAADYLLDAIDRASSASKSERIEFLEAYDAAKAQVCRVTVSVSEAHARILLDGNLKQEDGITGFTMFIEPGEHELRGRIKGIADAYVNFTAKKGTEMRVHLEFVSKLTALPELPEPVILPPRNAPAMLRSSNIATDPNYSTKEDPFYEPPKPPKEEEKPGPRFSVNGGIVTIFGVASWNPAVGGVIGVGLKANEYLSFGLEGRAAWLTTDVAEGSAIGAMTAGGLLSACGHLRWFFGCGLGYFGTIITTYSSDVYSGKSYSFTQPGIGARLGFEARAVSSLLIGATADAIAVPRGLQLGVGDIIIAYQPPILIGVQLTAGWEF